MKKFRVALLCAFVFLSSNLNAQTWSGWRFSAEPTATWFFGTGNRVGSIYRISTDIISFDPYVFNYDRHDRQLYVGGGSGLGWRFELTRRGRLSKRGLGLNVSFLPSRGTVSRVARTPSRVNYSEGCWMFGQTLEPLENDLEKSRTASVHCGGENGNSLTSINLFAEYALLENDRFGVYPRMGFGRQLMVVRWHEWMRTDAVLLNYFDEGNHFLNHIALDGYMRSRSLSFGPNLGVRIGLTRGHINLEATFEQSVVLTQILVDSAVWTDIDDIHIATGTRDSITNEGQTAAYLDGRVPSSSISERRVSFPRQFDLRGTFRVMKYIFFRFSAFCGSLPAMHALKFEIPADWTLFQGSGWQMSRLNPSYCGAGAGVRLNL